MAKWSIDLEKYAKVKKQHIQKVRRSFVYLLYANIVKRTPVDTGRARGNWVVSAGSPSEEVDEQKKEARYTSKNDIPAVEGDDSAFITNNLPYINTLEYGGYPKDPKRGSLVKDKSGKRRYIIKSKGGFSKQAPNGMVGVTVAEASRLFQSALAEARK